MAIALRVEDLVPNMIAVRERLRPLSEGAVTDLMQSMDKIGLVSPILIARPNGISPELVSGAHRLEAAKRLKWKSIPCVVYEGTSEDERQLAEIDENLVRSDLSPAERAAHIAARKEIYERQNPEAKHGTIGRGRKKSSQVEKSFVADTAKKTGRGRSSVARDATRAKKVPQIAAVAHTSLDTGEELDALGGLPPEEQNALIDRAKAGEKVSARTSSKAGCDWWVPQIRALFIQLSQFGDEPDDENDRETCEVELERLIDEIVGRYREGPA